MFAYKIFQALHDDYSYFCCALLMVSYMVIPSMMIHLQGHTYEVKKKIQKEKEKSISSSECE